MSDTVTQMYGVMFFRLGSQGWSEKFWLKTSDYATAIAALTPILNARLGLLPSAAEVVWARVGFAGRPRERKPLVLAYPVAGNADTAAAPYVATDADVNDVEAAVMIAMGTATGRWANYFMRALPDDRVTGRALINPVTVPAGSTPVTPVPSWEVRLGNYLQLIRETTYLAKLKTKGVPPAADTYTNEAWDSAVIRGIRNKKTGRPFGESRGKSLVGG